VRGWRRIHFTAPGLVYTVGALAVGFAAINTGNNLLFLLLGAMLGTMAVSGWLSEQTVRGLQVRRTVPRGVPVGQEVRIRYEVRNPKRRLSSLALELHEPGLPGAGFVAHLAPGKSANARAVNVFERRGVHDLGTLTLATTFPFGLFRRERDLSLPGELVIWPRTDRPVRPPRSGGGQRPSPGMAPLGVAASVRGEYRGLREYRPGDDARDIHWRSSARMPGRPVVREYDRDAGETLWICLDTGAQPGPAAEHAVEIAAALMSRASAEGRPFALVAGTRVVPTGLGSAQLERALDELSRVDFRPQAPPVEPPVNPASCVLVSVDGRASERYADAFQPGNEV
jgi:uncharacterized protein (DUF58 family)